MDHIAANLAQVKATIAQAAADVGRDPQGVQLVAVSKTFAADQIRPALRAGHRLFAENRVQEAAGKWPALRQDFADVQLHLIGPLQTNKVRDAVALFDCIQSLDRPKLARALADEFQRVGRSLPVMVQVNIGQEPQKNGIDPEHTDRFVQLVRGEYGLDVVGLMCIPPAQDDPVPHFQALARLAEQSGVVGLSMGMSGDYAQAVAAGAHWVRVGSALFGRR